MNVNEDKHNHKIEEQLLSKIRSMMTVSTFLAGFTFAVLNDLLNTESLKCPQILASIFFTGSFSLFVASVYMYDQLIMPKKYWPKVTNSKKYWPKVTNSKKCWSKLTNLKKFLNSVFAPNAPPIYLRSHNELLHYYMIRTWNLLFTPAVFLAFIGFIITLSNTNNYWIIGLGIVIIVAVIFCYCKMKPVIRRATIKDFYEKN